MPAKRHANSSWQTRGPPLSPCETEQGLVKQLCPAGGWDADQAGFSHMALFRCLYTNLKRGDTQQRVPPCKVFMFLPYR